MMWLSLMYISGELTKLIDHKRVRQNKKQVLFWTLLSSFFLFATKLIYDDGLS